MVAQKQSVFRFYLGNLIITFPGNLLSLMHASQRPLQVSLDGKCHLEMKKYDPDCCEVASLTQSIFHACVSLAKYVL